MLLSVATFLTCQRIGERNGDGQSGQVAASQAPGTSPPAPGAAEAFPPDMAPETSGDAGAQASADDLPPVIAEIAPANPDAAIAQVSLGWNDYDAEGLDPDRVGTEFAHGVMQVVVWFRWADARPPRRIGARWTWGELFLHQVEDVIRTKEGTGWWGLRDEERKPLPPGDYRVELLEEGKEVATIPFRIAPGPDSLQVGGGMPPEERPAEDSAGASPR